MKALIVFTLLVATSNLAIAADVVDCGEATTIHQSGSALEISEVRTVCFGEPPVIPVDGLFDLSQGAVKYELRGDAIYFNGLKVGAVTATEARVSTRDDSGAGSDMVLSKHGDSVFIYDYTDYSPGKPDMRIQLKFSR